MKSLTKRWLAFAATCATSAFAGWLAGYNFDERTPVAAAWLITTLLLSFVVVTCAVFSDD